MAKIIKNGKVYADSINSSVVTTASAGLAPQLPSSEQTSKYLRADGTWQTPTDTTYGAATTSKAGLMPILEVNAGGQTSKYLKADGTWQTPPNTTYGTATTAANGLMSSFDKTKLDNVASTYLPLSGGTMTGNILIRKDDAVSSVDIGKGTGESDYGRFVLRRSGYYMIVDTTSLTANRQVHFQNLNGTVRISTNHYAEEFVGETNEKWKSLFNRLRDACFNDSLMRTAYLRVSSLDSISRLIFHCNRFSDQNTSQWSTGFCTATAETTYYISFGSNDACAIRKVVKSTNGTITITDLSATSAAGASVQVI